MNSSLAAYTRLLASWPGLTGPTGAGLVEDCLVLLPHLEGVRALVDVGAGGGMPGIPLAIVRPELEVTLLEADRGKIAFLHHAAAALGLARVKVLAERAETVGRGPLRESFDAAVSRALAPMAVTAELCLPLVRVGGRLLAMKSSTENVFGAAAAVAAFGGGELRVVPAPSAARARGVIVIAEKLRPTPAAYPRRPGVPRKRPWRG